MASSTQALTRLVAPNTFTTPTALLTRESPVDKLESAAYAALSDPSKAGTFTNLMYLANQRRPLEEKMLADYATQVQQDRMASGLAAAELLSQQRKQVNADAFKTTAGGIKELGDARDPLISPSAADATGVDPNRGAVGARIQNSALIAKALEQAGIGMHQAAEGGANAFDPVSELIGMLGLPKPTPMSPLKLSAADISNNKDQVEAVTDLSGNTTGYRAVAKGGGNLGARANALADQIRTSKPGANNAGIRTPNASAGAATQFIDNLRAQGWQHVGTQQGNDGTSVVRMKAPNGQIQWKRFEADGRPSTKGVE